MLTIHNMCIGWVISLVAALFICSSVSAKEAISRAYVTEAQSPWLPNRADKEKEFKFRNGLKAKLFSNGDYSVTAVIRHSRLLCGNYGVGIQFSTEQSSCSDIKWPRAPISLTHMKHCNSAVRIHQGVHSSEFMAAQFDQVTCARVVIRCTGTCDWNIVETSR